MDFWANTPQYLNFLLQLAGALAVVLGGIFVFLNYFDKVRKERHAEADALDDKIINRLKEDVDLQGKQIVSLQVEVKKVRDENMKLATENKTLTKILQGRDESSEAMRIEAFRAIKQIDTMHDIILEMNKQNVDSNKNVERLAISIEKFVNAKPN